MAVNRYVASALYSGGQTAALVFLVSDGKDLMLIDAIWSYPGMPLAALCEGQL